ncbi:hypothetical protein NL676_035387 [Syzygium grande]|nr:hypothetical protein NL676_035387 [Syzygium grande]
MLLTFALDPGSPELKYIENFEKSLLECVSLIDWPSKILRAYGMLISLLISADNIKVAAGADVLIAIEDAALEPPVATRFFIAFSVIMMRRSGIPPASISSRTSEVRPLPRHARSPHSDDFCSSPRSLEQQGSGQGPYPQVALRVWKPSFRDNASRNVGFIGLGNMGSRMAKNLVKAGYNVAVHDVNGDAMKIFVGIGVPTKKTPFEVAEESDVIMTMLPSSSHVFDVYTGPNGLLHGGNLLRPWLLIDSSTIDPQTSRKISALVSNCTLKGKRDANIRRHTIRRDNRERGEEKKSSGATSSISDHSSNQALPCSIPVALSSCPAPEFLLLQPNVTCDSTDVAALRLLLSNFNETPL